MIFVACENTFYYVKLICTRDIPDIRLFPVLNDLRVSNGVPLIFLYELLYERSRILLINRTNRISISHVAFEKRAIQATGEVQQQLKCPVSFHPGRDAAAPLEIMRIYQEAGGDAKKAILSHLDRTCNHMPLNDTRCSTIDIC